MHKYDVKLPVYFYEFERLRLIERLIHIIKVVAQRRRAQEKNTMFALRYSTPRFPNSMISLIKIMNMLETLEQARISPPSSDQIYTDAQLTQLNTSGWYSPHSFKIDISAPSFAAPVSLLNVPPPSKFGKRVRNKFTGIAKETQVVNSNKHTKSKKRRK